MIYLKNPTEIKEIEYINKLGAELLQMCYDHLKPGVVLLELEEIVLRYCIDKKVLSSFKRYRGFPHSICVSINEEVIHGFPDGRIIKDGDIVSVDVGLKSNGYYSDAAFTKIIGKVPKRTKKLVRTAYECLYKSIKKAIPGNRINDVSAAIQSQIDNLNTCTGELQDQIWNNDADIVNLQTQITNNDTDITNLQNDLANNEASLSCCESLQ